MTDSQTAPTENERNPTSWPTPPFQLRRRAGATCLSRTGWIWSPSTGSRWRLKPAQVDQDFAGASRTACLPNIREQLCRSHSRGPIWERDVGQPSWAGQNTSGAEAEAQAAWQIQGNEIPMAMIAELRTVSAPDDGGGVSAFTGYVFPASLSRNLRMSPASRPARSSTFSPAFLTSWGSGPDRLKGQRTAVASRP